MKQPDPTEVDPVDVVYPRRIIVKFINDIGIPYQDNAELNLPKEWPDKWKEILEIYPAATLTRLYVATSSDRLQQLDKQAQVRDKSYEHVDLLTFFTISLASTDKADSILASLSQWEIIEYAYLEALPGPNPTTPQSAPANPGYENGSQGYLQPSNHGNYAATFIGGINAEAAWPLLGAVGSGAGISFIDIEKQWDLNDPEWTDSANNVHFDPTSLIYGYNYSDPAELDPQHGSKVLGILGMQDNMSGGVGIAPDATGRVVSVWRDCRPGDAPTSLPYVYDLPEALMKAIDILGFGDVLLIECQMIPTSGANVLQPVEMDPAVFTDIRLATALGIAVVEPAGNMARGASNTVNLDDEANGLGVKILNRADQSAASPFRDSGAIMVASAFATPTSTPEYPKTFTNEGYWNPDSNYGSRVDCFAWGEGVFTTGGGNTTTGSFGGTSAASAIVAGAVILLQALAKARLQAPFHPWQLRHILTSTGTPPASDNPVTNPIGVMPNLKAFIDNALNLTPDIVIRDHPGDNGDPHSDATWASPDIDVVPSGSGPQSAFARSSFGLQIGTGDQEIYVRVFNRGGVTATGVQATVYWSPASTLLTPNMWTNIGASSPVDVLANASSMTILPSILWPSSAIPRSSGPIPDPLCLIVTIGCPDDPDPIPNPTTLSLITLDNFVSLIASNNNVTCNSVITFTTTASASALMANTPVALNFLAPGAHDIDRLMQLEVIAHLPEGSQLWLEGQADFLNALIKGYFEKVQDEKNRLPLSPYGVNRFKEIMFLAGSLNPLQLQVSVPENYLSGDYEIYIRHLYKGEEIGRVTWLLAPPEKKSSGS